MAIDLLTSPRIHLNTNTYKQGGTGIQPVAFAHKTERANYQLFLSELCDYLEVPRPNPAVGDNLRDAYVFDRPVTFRRLSTASLWGRLLTCGRLAIDLLTFPRIHPNTNT